MPRPFLKFTNQTLLEKYMAVITAAMVKELRVMQAAAAAVLVLAVSSLTLWFWSL